MARSKTRQYKGHAVKGKTGKYVVVAYDRAFSTLKKARAWLDRHVAGELAKGKRARNPKRETRTQATARHAEHARRIRASKKTDRLRARRRIAKSPATWGQITTALGKQTYVDYWPRDRAETAIAALREAGEIKGVGWRGGYAVYGLVKKTKRNPCMQRGYPGQVQGDVRRRQFKPECATTVQRNPKRGYPGQAFSTHATVRRGSNPSSEVPKTKVIGGKRFARARQTPYRLKSEAKKRQKTLGATKHTRLLACTGGYMVWVGGKKKVAKAKKKSRARRNPGR